MLKYENSISKDVMHKLHNYTLIPLLSNLKMKHITICHVPVCSQMPGARFKQDFSFFFFFFFLGGGVVVVYFYIYIYFFFVMFVVHFLSFFFFCFSLNMPSINLSDM